MSWPKTQLIDQAFAEIGMAVYVFDIAPEQRQLALNFLDSMVADWEILGIFLGFQFGDEQQDSGISDRSNLAVYTNLAVRMAPSFGKTPSIETKTAAQKGYESLLIVAARPTSMQMPRNLPRGAGQKSWQLDYGPFVSSPNRSPISNQPTDTDLDLEKD